VGSIKEKAAFISDVNKFCGETVTDLGRNNTPNLALKNSLKRCSLFDKISFSIFNE